MARRHNGLGRGLDALIPQAPAAEGEGQHREVQQTPAAQETAPVAAAGGAPGAAAKPQDGAVMVRLALIEPNRSQPRKSFDEASLQELADSIARYGLLSPLLVQDRGDHYEIIAGERRWRAAKKAGLHEVPVIIRKLSDQEIMELSLIENIQREDLNPIEEARAYRQLIDQFGLRQEDIAERLSKSRSAVTNSMRLLKLDSAVQELVASGQITTGHARALVVVEDPGQQKSIAQRVIDEGLSVRDVEKLVKDLGKAPKPKPAKPARDPQLELIYRQLEEKLGEKLETKVAISSTKSGGRLEIDFYSSSDLEKLIDRLTAQ